MKILAWWPYAWHMIELAGEMSFCTHGVFCLFRSPRPALVAEQQIDLPDKAGQEWDGAEAARSFATRSRVTQRRRRAVMRTSSL
jgi:hypothetical protein